MRDIARESGTSASTVYRYFESKAEVLRYLADGIARSDAAAARRISGVLEGEGRATAETLSSTADPERLWKLVRPPGGGRARDEDRLRTELWAEASRAPGVAEALRSGVRMVREALGDPGDASKAAPDLNHARLLAAAFYGAHMMHFLEANSPVNLKDQRVD